MIFALCGVSGAGKTYYRRREPYLRTLAYFDISDVYAENPGVNAAEAFDILVERIDDHLNYENDGSDIVVEAFFHPERQQRPRLQDLADEHGLEINWYWFYESREECRERVLADRRRNGARRRRQRLKFILQADESCFEPVFGEDPPELGAVGDYYGQGDYYNEPSFDSDPPSSEEFW